MALEEGLAVVFGLEEGGGKGGEAGDEGADAGEDEDDAPEACARSATLVLLPASYSYGESV